MTPRLQARDLRLAYGDNIIMDGLDLDVLDGTVSAVNALFCR